MDIFTKRNIAIGFVILMGGIIFMNLLIMIISFIKRSSYGRTLAVVKEYGKKRDIVGGIICLIYSVDVYRRMNLNYERLTFLRKCQSESIAISADYFDKINTNIYLLKSEIIILMMLAIISFLKYLTKVKILEQGISSYGRVFKWDSISKFEWIERSEGYKTLQLYIDRRFFKQIKINIENEHVELVDDYLTSRLT